MVYYTYGQGYGSQAYQDRWYNAQGQGGGNMAWAAGVGAAAGAMASGAVGMYAQHLENKKAWHRLKKLNKRQLQWRVKDAEKAGIHPLAALGISPASGPTMGSLGDIDGAGAVQAGLNVASSFKSKEEKAIAKLAVDEAIEKNRQLGIQGQLMDIYLERLRNSRPGLQLGPSGDVVVDWMHDVGQGNAGAGAGGPGQTDSGVELQTKYVKPSGALGVEVGMEPFEKLKIDFDGFVYLLPSDSQDIEENAYVKAIYYARQGSRWAKGMIANNLVKFRKILHQVKRPPKGYVYVFRRSSGQFQLVRLKDWKDEVRRKYKEKHKKYKEAYSTEFPYP